MITTGRRHLWRRTNWQDRRPSGSTTLSYNHSGSSTETSGSSSANTYTATYTYDPAGHPLIVTYPSGRIVTYTRDALGRISGITTKQNSGSTAVTIFPASAMALRAAHRRELRQRRHARARLRPGLPADIDQRDDGHSTIQDLSYGSYDAYGNIQGITDNLTSARTQSLHL